LHLIEYSENIININIPYEKNTHNTIFIIKEIWIKPKIQIKNNNKKI